jgi:hypothetical protein
MLVTVLFALWSVHCLVAGPAYQADQSSAIMGTVVRHVYERSTFNDATGRTRSTIKVDGLVFGPGFRAGVNHPPSAERFAAATLDGMAIAGSGELVSAERASLCAAWAPRDCMVNGASVVVNFARPLVQGDSASIDVLARVSWPVIAEDSARMVNGPGGLFRLGLRRAHATTARVFLTRQSSGWTVYRIVVLSQT